MVFHRRVAKSASYVEYTLGTGKGEYVSRNAHLLPISRIAPSSEASASCSTVVPAMLSRASTVGILKIRQEVADAADAALGGDLFNAEKRRFQQFFRLLHPELPEVGHWRCAGLGSKELP
jgi:hypothetical protein